MTTMLWLIAALTANSAGILLLKHNGTLAAGAGPIATYLNPWFIAGAAFFGLNLLLFTQALKGMPVSVAYPLLVAGSLVLVTGAALVLFHEPMTLAKAGGIALLIGGVVLLNV